MLPKKKNPMCYIKKKQSLITDPGDLGCQNFCYFSIHVILIGFMVKRKKIVSFNSQTNKNIQVSLCIIRY